MTTLEKTNSENEKYGENYVKAGTVLYHGIYSEKIDIKDGKNILYFGLESLPSLAILTEHQNKREDKGRLLVFKAKEDIILASTRSIDIYFQTWLINEEDKAQLKKDFINPNNIVATTISNEVVLIFNSNEDFDRKMELIQTWEVPMEKVYDYLDTLPRFAETIFTDTDIIIKAKAMLHKMDLVNKIEDYINSILVAQ